MANKLKAMLLGGSLLYGLPDAPAKPAAAPVDLVVVARQTWDATLPRGHEPYLRGRGITMTPLPETLRFHPRLYHKASHSHHPAMVAAVQNVAGDQIAIHRTWLAPRGAGKAAIEPDKMALCPTKGGAVRLGEGGDVLLVAEGIESALSIAQLYGAPAWAALSAPGLQSLVVPPEYTEVIIAADNDPVGLAAADHRPLERPRRATTEYAAQQSR